MRDESKLERKLTGLLPFFPYSIRFSAPTIRLVITANMGKVHGSLARAGKVRSQVSHNPSLERAARKEEA